MKSKKIKSFNISYSVIEYFDVEIKTETEKNAKEKLLEIIPDAIIHNIVEYD
jgi:translation initiation factor IF-2